MKATSLALVLVAAAILLVAPARATATTADAKGTDSPDVTKDMVSPEDVKQLANQYCEQGSQHYEAGRLIEARARLRAALTLDPDHTRAKLLLDTVEKKLGITGADKLREKLARIIPEAKFTHAPVSRVVNFLAREAEVNIVFDASALAVLGPDNEAAGAQGDDAEGTEAEGERPSPVPARTAQRPASARRDLVTIHLKNVPLKEVLRYVLRIKGLKYIVEDYAILIVPIGWDHGENITEVFHLRTGGANAQRIVDRITQEFGSRESEGY